MIEATDRTPFGAGARLHHVGMVVPSLEEHCPGCDAIEDPRQRVRVAFVRLHDARIELIEPLGAGSPVARSLEKGTKIVHLCFEVDDLETALATGADNGFRTLARPVPAVAFGGRRIAWCFSPTFGLVELLETGPETETKTGTGDGA